MENTVGKKMERVLIKGKLESITIGGNKDQQNEGRVTIKYGRYCGRGKIYNFLRGVGRGDVSEQHMYRPLLPHLFFLCKPPCREAGALPGGSIPRWYREGGTVHT